jgi:hypothetical protein
MTNAENCRGCGVNLPDLGETCPVCGTSPSSPESIPTERVAGETALDIVDVELETRKVIKSTGRGPVPSQERTEPDDLWWVRSNQ